MSNNTYIRVPLSVHSEKLARVVAKLMGAPCFQENKVTKLVESKTTPHGPMEQAWEDCPFAANEPASLSNPWRVIFNDPKAFEVKSTNLTSGFIEVKDALGQTHSWFLVAEDENERYKTLLPDATGLSVAVGRRLVRFFGGELVEESVLDMPAALSVAPGRAAFPPRKAHQASDDRYYQFQTALAREPVLGAQELAEALAHQGGTQSHWALLDRLRKNEQAQRLEHTLPTPAPRVGPRL